MTNATTAERKQRLGISGNGAQVIAPSKTTEQVRVTPPKMRTVKLRIEGTAPYLQCRFAEKAMHKIMEKQSKGDAALAGKRPRRAARDFDADYKGSLHRIKGGGYGIPAGAFRAASISACRLIGYKMTIAKLSIFILADGYDDVDATPLVKITGKPEKHVMMGRNSDGTPGTIRWPVRSTDCGRRGNSSPRSKS